MFKGMEKRKGQMTGNTEQGNNGNMECTKGICNKLIEIQNIFQERKFTSNSQK